MRALPAKRRNHSRRTSVESRTCKLTKNQFVYGVDPNFKTVFEGIAVIDGKLVTDSCDLVDHGESGRGCYVTFKRTDAGEITISIDPFGYYPLHIYNKDGVFCAATRVRQMVQVLRALGRPLHRDLTIYGWFVAQGGATGGSGYREISLLGRGTTVRVSRENQVSFEHEPSSVLFYSSRPLGELIDDAAHEIITNIRVLAGRSFETRTCYLSGGRDTRLVLSAILHEHMQDNFQFHTKGKYPHPDANVAALLRSRFGLRRARGGNFDETKLSPFNSLRASVGRMNGLCEFPRGARSISGRDQIRHLAVGGSTGELLREYWSSGNATGRKDTPSFGKKLKVREKSSTLDVAFYAKVIEAINKFSIDTIAEGIRKEHVGDLLYIVNRAKYHFGVSWAYGRRTWFHPLYSPAALLAAHAMPNPEKAANRLGFELMSRFCPELIHVPFANVMWSPRNSSRCAAADHSEVPIPRGS